MSQPSAGSGRSRSTTAPESPLRRAVLFDRDGVLNALVGPAGGPAEAPLRRADVRLLPGAAEAVTRLRAAGYATAIVTNQPAAAKGEAPAEQVDATHAEVLRQLAGRGAVFDAVLVCPHHPHGRPGHRYTGACNCRKPAPGLLLAALAALGADPRRSWMVGDSDSDVAAGRAAGVSTVLVESAGGAHKRSGDPPADATVPDTRAAADRILADRPAQGPPEAPAHPRH